MRTINKIIIHCSATPEGRKTTVKDIEAWHKERGFNQIGYHYVIYLDGSIHTGRPEQVVGAHCLGQNQDSIGICYIGGCDKNGKPKDTRTFEQKMALIDLLVKLVIRYPHVSIHGHNEFAAKDCPCFNVKEEYKCI